MEKIKTDFDNKYGSHINKEEEKYSQQNLLDVEGNTLKSTKKGACLRDGIAAQLFFLNAH